MNYISIRRSGRKNLLHGISRGLRDVSRKNQFLPGTIRPGRFAQKIERDGSRKKAGTIRSKSNLEVDSPIFVIYIYYKCFALQMSMISISLYACECGKRFNTVPHIC